MPTSVARFLALVAVAAIVGGAWLDWILGVPATHIPLWRLGGSHMRVETDAFYKSFAIVLVVCAIVAAIGVLLPSRAAAFVPAVVVLAVTALLLIQEWRVLPDHLNQNVVDGGVWCSGAGAVLLVIASFGLSVNVQRDVIVR